MGRTNQNKGDKKNPFGKQIMPTYAIVASMVDWLMPPVEKEDVIRRMGVPLPSTYALLTSKVLRNSIHM